VGPPVGRARFYKPANNARHPERSGLPGNVVGMVDIRARHLFADVASEHAETIVAKLKRAQMKGCRIKAKLA
jgi:hypothetical protein